jgi:hypothetical protein
MTTIGFATQFYTLWDVTKEDLFSTTVTAGGEMHHKTGERFVCVYIKNISTDLDKVLSLYPDAPINEDLRGKSRSFEYTTGNQGVTYGDDVFAYGYNKGKAIAECISIRDLSWALQNESNSGRARNIKNQMIALGMAEYDGKMYENQEKVDAIIARRNEADKLRINAECIYSSLTKGGKLVVNFNKNLTTDGRYYDAENGIHILFKDFKSCYYNGFEYCLPTIKGVGKKVKGKVVELECQTLEDLWSEHGELVLVVNSFKTI